MSKVEDDFWNTSSHSGFNFDDEEDPATASLLDDFVFHSISEESAELPIHALISKNCLELVLADIRLPYDVMVPPVEETVKKMSNNFKCINLQDFVTFQDKMQLLDHALNSYDGNIILKVILFLKSTLKTNIFFHQLSKRKAALKHYGYYLMVNNLFDELVDLYVATDNTSHMKALFYLNCQAMGNRELVHTKLEQFVMQHLQNLNSTEDKLELNENLQLIKYQRNEKRFTYSIIEQFANLCKSEIRNKSPMEKLQNFKRTFKLDDPSFDWILLNVIASMKLWNNLTDIFITESMWPKLTNTRKFKSSISPEMFVNGLGKHNPPKEVLEQVLTCITDSNKALSLAQKFSCHNFVIQFYINRKDRLALLNYRKKVSPQSSEYSRLETSLQSTDIKWKN